MFAAGPKRAFRLLFNFCKFCETFTLKMFLVKKVKHEISILPWDSRYFCSVDNKHYFHIFQNITSCMWRVVLFKLLYRLFILTVGLAEIIPLGYFRFYSCQNGSIIREETVVSFLGYTKYTY